MTNYEYITRLSVEELTKLLIKEEEYDDGEYYYDEYSPCYITRYLTPDGGKWQDYEDAYDFTVEWLRRERGVDYECN